MAPCPRRSGPPGRRRPSPLAARRPLPAWRRWPPWLLALALGAVRAAGEPAGAGSAEEASSEDFAAAPSPSGAKRPRRPRVRATCAPELDLLDPKAETARTYAQNFQKFCNGSSPWAEQLSDLPDVLGFVAPWSDHGYRAARYFRGKFSALSPLWFRVLPGKGTEGANAFEIAGWEIAKEQERWSKQAAAEFCLGELCGDGPEVLPHFSLEGFDKLAALRAVLEAPIELAAEVAVTCERGGFQGAVFDVRLALFPGLKALVPRLAAELGRALHSAHRRLFLSVPAPLPGAAKGPAFDASDAAAVAGHVDGIVLGTRDFSRKEPGPTAPLPWVRASVERLLKGAPEGSGGLKPEQLIVEIPLYGRAFQEGASEGRVIVAGEIAKALAKQRPEVEWDAEAAEHSATLAKSRVRLSLPSLASVAERLRLARELGVGVALRDLGGGLDAAFDLLPARSEGTAADSPEETKGGDGAEKEPEGRATEL